MRFSPFSAYRRWSAWSTYELAASRPVRPWLHSVSTNFSLWVTIAHLWLSLRQFSFHPHVQSYLSCSVAVLLVNGLAPSPAYCCRCYWFPSQLSRMITGSCALPGALLLAHFYFTHAAGLRLTGAHNIRRCWPSQPREHTPGRCP